MQHWHWFWYWFSNEIFIPQFLGVKVVATLKKIFFFFHHYKFCIGGLKTKIFFSPPILEKGENQNTPRRTLNLRNLESTVIWVVFFYPLFLFFNNFLSIRPQCLSPKLLWINGNKCLFRWITIWLNSLSCYID